LPTNNNDLETSYTTQDETDVADDDGVRVNQSATDEYAIHQFKNFVGGNSASFIWNGQSDLACSASTIYLQIYDTNLTTWETVDSDSTTAANTDFDLTFFKSNLTDYKNNQGIVTCRVYQLAQ
jgi:hypothetical protein